MNTSSLIEAVEKRFPDGVSTSYTYRGDATVVLRPAALLEVARFLKEDPAFSMNFLVDVTAVDYSAFGKGPAPAFFASSGVTVSPFSSDSGSGPVARAAERGALCGRVPLLLDVQKASAAPFGSARR